MGEPGGNPGLARNRERRHRPARVGIPVPAARSFGCKVFAMIISRGAALLALVLTGCGPGGEATAPPAPAATTTPAAAAAGFPRTLELPEGGTLTLAAPP